MWKRHLLKKKSIGLGKRVKIIKIDTFNRRLKRLYTYAKDAKINFNETFVKSYYIKKKTQNFFFN